MLSRLAFVSLLLVTACTDPRQACINKSSKDLKTVRVLIEDTEATIERGYAIQTETRTVIYTDFCVGTGIGSNGRFGFCNRGQPVTSKKPVAVDLNAERRKLISLREKEVELRAKTANAIQRCELQYPKT